MAGESISLPPWSPHKYEQADTKVGGGGYTAASAQVNSLTCITQLF